jgi:hypothetical protein
LFAGGLSVAHPTLPKQHIENANPSFFPTREFIVFSFFHQLGFFENFGLNFSRPVKRGLVSKPCLQQEQEYLRYHRRES